MITSTARRLIPLARLTRGRVAQSVGANALGKLWMMLVQLLSVPVIVSSWGIDGYGIWLMLAGLPTFVGLSELGLLSVGAVEITRHAVNEDFREAKRIFRSIWLMVSGISISVIAAIYTTVITAEHFSIISMQAKSEDLIPAFQVLLVYSAVVIQTSLINNGFRCGGKYALGTVVSEIISPIETLTMLLVIIYGGGYFEASLVLLVVRIIGTGILYSLMRTSIPWLSLGAIRVRLGEFKSFVRPALGGLAVPAAHTLSLQGIVLFAGLWLGPAIAGTFGAFRAITRPTIHLASIIGRGIAPELTLAYVQDQPYRIAALMRKALTLTAVGAVPFCATIAAAGPEIFQWYTSGRATVSLLASVALSYAALVQAASTVASTWFLALNRAHAIAVQSLLFAVASVTVPTMLGAGSLEDMALLIALIETSYLIFVALAMRTAARRI